MISNIGTVCVIVASVVGAALTGEILFYVAGILWVYLLLMYKSINLIGEAFDSECRDDAIKVHVMLTLTLHMLFITMISILAWRFLTNPTFL